MGAHHLDCGTMLKDLKLCFFHWIKSDFSAGYVVLHITVSGKHTISNIIYVSLSHAQDTEGVNGTVKWLLSIVAISKTESIQIQVYYALNNY
jgi:hypothetical protein